MGRVVPLQALPEALAAARAAGQRVVLTNGCFDLLHVGHVRLLQQARALGDLLVVGVNGDASVRHLKGPGRPLIPATERAEVVAALGAVDVVCVFSEPTAEHLVALARPAVYVKGADYARPAGPAGAPGQDGPGGRPAGIDERRLPEARVVRQAGGQVVLLPLVPDRSTSALVERIRDGGDHGAGAGGA